MTGAARHHVDHAVVADAVAAWLANREASTATEIARAIHRRRATVDQVLEAGSRFVRVVPPVGRSRKAKTWTAIANDEGQVGTSPSADARERTRAWIETLPDAERTFAYVLVETFDATLGEPSMEAA